MISQRGTQRKYLNPFCLRALQVSCFPLHIRRFSDFFVECVLTFLTFLPTGALPYLGTAASTLYSAQVAGSLAAGHAARIDFDTAMSVLEAATQLQVTYGAVLLSVLGALHWGMEFTGYAGHKGVSWCIEVSGCYSSLIILYQATAGSPSALPPWSSRGPPWLWTHQLRSLRNGSDSAQW